MSLGAESPAWGNAGAAGRASQVHSGRAEACRAMSRCVRLVVSCLAESSPVEARSVASSQSRHVSPGRAEFGRVVTSQSGRVVFSRTESSHAKLGQFRQVWPGSVASSHVRSVVPGLVEASSVAFCLVSPVKPSRGESRFVRSSQSRQAWSRFAESRYVVSVEPRRDMSRRVQAGRVQSSHVSRVRFRRGMPCHAEACLPVRILSHFHGG